MKTFSKFGSRTIRLAGADQRLYEAKRLTIAQLEELDRIAEAAFDSSRGISENIRCHDGARRLMRLLRGTLPEKIAADLIRFSFQELLDLCLYLGYGNDDEPDNVAEIPSVPAVDDMAKKKL